MVRDFSVRSNAPEIMDDLNCGGEVVHQTLREIATINKLLGGNNATVNGIERLLNHSRNKDETLSVADLGCGGGEMLKLIAGWGKKNGRPLTLTGIDANPNIIAFARRESDPALGISFETMDIFSREFERRRYDIVTATLFFHHFDADTLSGFFKLLHQRATIGVVINDIHRHPLAYYPILFLTRLLSRSSMVKYDAPLSVLRAFKKRELTQILARSGISHYTIRWMWAFRWQVIIHSAPDTKSVLK
jgi:2-polyprenyl-3-methyl-5-hydroxy-6-metoxy-1,4-benzoquinol methylase